MTDAEQRAWDLILKHRDFYGAYNVQKENAAFVATALFLTGASAIIAGDFWTMWPRTHQAALGVGVVLAAALTLVFVWWQFDQRFFAIAMVAACTDLAARGILTAPPESQLKPRRLNGRDWPAALVERFNEVADEIPSLPRNVTALAIGLWMAAAIVRVVENCR